MKILEFETEKLDTLDPDVIEKIENARDKVLEACEKSESEEKQSVAVRTQCEAVAEFIDALFGNGTAKKVFGEKTSLLKAMKAFEDVMRGLNEDTESQTAEIQNIIKKYSPKRIIKK